MQQSRIASYPNSLQNKNMDECVKVLGILFYKPNKLRPKSKPKKKSPHSPPVQPVLSNTSPQFSTSTFFLGGNASATLGLPARLCGHRLLGSTYTYLSLTPFQTTYLDFGHLLWAWNSHQYYRSRMWCVENRSRSRGICRGCCLDH